MSYANSYRRAFTLKGRRVTLQRGAIIAGDVRARMDMVGDVEVAGGIGSAVYRVLILAEDVPPALRPLRKGDEVVVDGRTLIFLTRPDDQKRRDGETLLAYEGEASGS